MSSIFDFVEMVFTNIQLFLIVAAPIAFLIWIIAGFKRGESREKEKHTTKIQLILCSLFCLITLPVAFFIGVMATDSSDGGTDATPMFWSGFWYIWAFPLLCLVTNLIKWFIQRKRR